MRRIYLTKLWGLLAIGTMLLSGGVLQAQENPDRATVAFSDPSRPGTVNLHLFNGSLSVKAYPGKEVIVDTRRRTDTNERRTVRISPETAGLHRIDDTASGLVIEEENNVMTIATSRMTPVSMDIQVPVKTNLRLSVTNGGSLNVDGVEGDMEVNNTNGSIFVTDVSGSVIANSTNGKVIVVLKRIAPQKPMSFSSLNGTVDVTLPSDAKANVKMRTTNGEIWTDFDVKTLPSAKPIIDDSRRNGGRYRIEMDRTVNGTINGGGPDFDFRTTNANIYIRKPK